MQMNSQDCKNPRVLTIIHYINNGKRYLHQKVD